MLAFAVISSAVHFALPMGMRGNKERKQSLADLDAKAASALPGILQYFMESAKI
jgi:hypothetical protein